MCKCYKYCHRNYPCSICFYKKIQLNCLEYVSKLTNLGKYTVKTWTHSSGTSLTVFEFELFYYYEFSGLEAIGVGGKIYTHNLDLKIRRTATSPVTSFNGLASQGTVMGTNTFEIFVSQGVTLIHSLNSAGIIPKTF